MQKTKIRPNQAGFTLIELIAVLVIIAIVAAVAISKAISTSQVSVQSEANILKSHLRFAQIKAIGDVSADTWSMGITAGSYTITCTGISCPSVSVNLPGENSATHTFSGGVTATTAPTVTFDSFGSPGPTAVSITLAYGSQTQGITMAPYTGFMQ